MVGISCGENHDEMTHVLEKESLLSALTRVLREDGKRSMELVTNIIYVFFCFSNFTEFHALLTGLKMGDMCLKWIEQEKSRYQVWLGDYRKIDSKGINLSKILLL